MPTNTTCACTCGVRPIDVAQYIINHFSTREQYITTIKLQKLVYYSQAWSLVWDDEPLFEEDFEAWINGPVVRCLFDELKGYYYCPQTIKDADPNKLSSNQKETIDLVLDNYGKLTSSQLVMLTHSEDPWKNARGNLPPNCPSNTPITKQAIAHFYTGLLN